VNKQWIHLHSQSYSVFEPGGCSYHLRCRFYIKDEAHRVKRPFKFVNSITQHPDYHQELVERWEAYPPLFHSTSAMFKLSKKLKGLKPHFLKMGKQMVGAISLRTKEAYTSLCELQAKTMADPSSQAVQNEADAYEKWMRLSDIEEKYLRQKGKLHWLKVGDQNNKAFYTAAKLREIRNNIKEIQCEDGRIVDNLDQIKSEAERYFKEFLSFQPTDYVEWSREDLENTLTFKCDESDQSMLTAEVSNDEVKNVLFAMPTNKFPGPDRYSCEFFKDSWSIIGADFVVAIQSFFTTGFLPKGVNSTILALIPKKKEAKVMKDYRPISCLECSL